jgi:hypothetical protein
MIFISNHSPNQFRLKLIQKICMRVDIFKEALKEQAIRHFLSSMQQEVLSPAEDMKGHLKSHGSVTPTKMITNITILKS